MAFQNDKENQKNSKKVYDFDTDKGKKLDVSALFDLMAKSSDSPNEATKEPTPTIEFVIDDDSEKIINSAEEEKTNNEPDEKPKSKINYKNIIKCFIFSCLITGLLVIIWLICSKTFLIKHIIIEDSNHELSSEYLNDKSMETKIEVYKILRNTIGNNLFLQSTNDLQNEINKICNIYDIKITKTFPRTINAVYTLKLPYAIVSEQNKNYVLDKFGYIIDVDIEPDIELPKVKGIASKEYKIGDLLDDTDQIKYKNVVFFLETVDTISFEYKISSIDYSNLDKFTFYIEDEDILVYYGEIAKEIMNDKLLYLKSVIDQAKEKGLKGTLDISSEDYLKKSVLNAKYN